MNARIKEKEIGNKMTIRQLADLMMSKFSDIDQKLESIDRRFIEQSADLKEYIDSNTVMIINYVDNRVGKLEKIITTHKYQLHTLTKRVDNIEESLE